MKTSELIKFLKKNGCYLVDHRGEHDFWYSPITKREVQVPRHPSREIANGTVNKILKDAGLK